MLPLFILHLDRTATGSCYKSGTLLPIGSDIVLSPNTTKTVAAVPSFKTKPHWAKSGRDLLKLEEMQHPKSEVDGSEA